MVSFAATGQQGSQSMDGLSYLIYFLRLFFPIVLFWIYFKFKNASRKPSTPQHISPPEETELAPHSDNLLRHRNVKREATPPLTSTIRKCVPTPPKAHRAMTPDEAALMAQMQAAASFYSPQSPIQGSLDPHPFPPLPPPLLSVKGYAMETLMEVFAGMGELRKPRELQELSLLPISEANAAIKEQRKRLKKDEKKTKSSEKSFRRKSGAEGIDLVTKMVQQCSLDERSYVEMVVQLSVDKPGTHRNLDMDLRNILLGTLKFQQSGSAKVVKSILNKADKLQKTMPSAQPLMDACLYELAVRCALADTTRCPEGDLELAADLLKRMEVQMGPGAEPMPFTMDLIMERYKRYSQSLPQQVSATPSEAGSEMLMGGALMAMSTPQLQRAAARREEEEIGARLITYQPCITNNRTVLMAADLEKGLVNGENGGSKWNTNAPVFMPSNPPLVQSPYWSVPEHSEASFHESGILSCSATPNYGTPDLKPQCMLGGKGALSSHYGSKLGNTGEDSEAKNDCKVGSSRASK